MMLPSPAKPAKNTERLAGPASGAVPTLSERFPTLRSLVVDLEFFDSSGVNRLACMQYKPNLKFASPFFSFSRIQLDFGDQLQNAILASQKIIAGEIAVNPIPNLSRADEVRRASGFLRFTLSLEICSAPLNSHDAQESDN